MTETITRSAPAAGAPPVRQPQFVRRRRRPNSDAIQLRALATPSVIVLCLIGVYPIIYAVYQSLRSGSLISPGSFVGAANYKYVLTNGTFWASARFTLIFTVAAVVGSYVVGLALALTFQAGFPGARIIKPLLLLPWVVPVVVSMTSWSWLIGTGQGLAICRDVVVIKHNGTLTVEGAEGAGAIFTIRLPIDSGNNQEDEIL